MTYNLTELRQQAEAFQTLLDLAEAVLEELSADDQIEDSPWPSPEARAGFDRKDAANARVRALAARFVINPPARPPGPVQSVGEPADGQLH